MTSLVTIFVPEQFHGTTFEENATINGNQVPAKYATRIWNGHSVVDIPLGFFHAQISGPNGQKWVNANPEAMEWLGQADRRVMTCNAFPGESRGPRIAPAAPAPTTPAIVRMRAPDGVTAFSHNGNEVNVDKDGSVEVEADVAVVLRSHGFVNS